MLSQQHLDWSFTKHMGIITQTSWHIKLAITDIFWKKYYSMSRMGEIQEEILRKVEETFRLLDLGDVPVGQDPVGSAECVKSSFHLSQ